MLSSLALAGDAVRARISAIPASSSTNWRAVESLRGIRLLLHNLRHGRRRGCLRRRRWRCCNIHQCLWRSPASVYAVSRMHTRKIEVLPRRPHKSVREELRASQRGRLICAIADSVAAKGYAATSVADIIALAGVSRKTFYEHFADKEACFLAAYDAGAEAIYEAIIAAVDGLSSWEEILDSVLATWLEFLEADIAFTRAYMIEFWGAGDAARERWKNRRDRTGGLLKALHERIRDADPTVTPAS